MWWLGIEETFRLDTNWNVLLKPLCLFSQKTQSINLKIVNKIVPTIHAQPCPAISLGPRQRKKKKESRWRRRRLQKYSSWVLEEEEEEAKKAVYVSFLSGYLLSRNWVWRTKERRIRSKGQKKLGEGTSKSLWRYLVPSTYLLRNKDKCKQST